MQQIERNVYIEDSFLGVMLGGIVFPHGTIYIDAPLRAEDARTWRLALANQRAGPNRLLVNLDSHPDRTLGARTLDCTILAHQKTAHAFRNRPTVFKGQATENGAVWESYSEIIGMRWASPDITFTQKMSLNWGGPEIILEHHPGVTPGAIWAIIPAIKLVFVGDAVVIDQPPFLAQADLNNWLEGLELLTKQYKDFRIVSGRGGLTDDKAVRVQHRILKNMAKVIERLAKKHNAPEATEELVPSLLSEYNIPAEKREKYTNRLRHGLNQYFTRRYRPSNYLEQPPIEDSEQ